MKYINDYNIETVVRAIRLCQEFKDLTLTDTVEMLKPVFGIQILNEALTVMYK